MQKAYIKRCLLAPRVKTTLRSAFIARWQGTNAVGHGKAWQTKLAAAMAEDQLRSTGYPQGQWDRKTAPFLHDTEEIASSTESSTLLQPTTATTIKVNVKSEHTSPLLALPALPRGRFLL